MFPVCITMKKTLGGCYMDSVAAVVKSKIDMLLGEKDFVIVAIDGKCTSGKTTLASKLAELYDCNVFHMGRY